MEETLKDFLEWLPNNLEDIFEIIDNPQEVIDKYIEEQERQYYLLLLYNVIVRFNVLYTQLKLFICGTIKEKE